MIRFFLLAALIFKVSQAELFPIEWRVPLAGHRPLPGTPWPKPQHHTSTNRTFSIDPHRLKLVSNVQHCAIIDNALKRYKKLILIDTRYHSVPHLTVIENINVLVENSTDCDHYPPPEMDEEYWIDLPHEQDHQALVKSKTVWGALRGLETLSQLIHVNEKHQLLVNQTKVHDWPRYKYRGLLLDTARHFLPVKTLLANLDAMSYNKFNVFHWHLVDDQSFPLVSKKFPNLTEFGAYTRKHVYQPKDVKKVIEYARLRGIRVIPELDSPGHTHALARAFPDLLTPCYGQSDKPYTPNYPLFSPSEVLNPMHNKTFEVMRHLFEEFRNTFPDQYIHLGMDEVQFSCWDSNPQIKSFMKKHQWHDLHQVEQYYVERTLYNVRNVGYKYLMWQDPVDKGVKLANDSIVLIWKDHSLDSSMDLWQNYIKNVSKNGYSMVLSACWYLNYINYPYPGKDWENYYLCDPRNFNGTEREKELVIGGQACLWGEFVDATNLLSRLWPRASAVAERLWSDPNQTQDVDTARHRLDQHRCRMLRRHIPAAPILNGFCGDYEWDMADSINFFMED